MNQNNWVKFLQNKGNWLVNHIHVEGTRDLVAQMHATAVISLTQFVERGDRRSKMMAKGYDNELELMMKRHLLDEDINSIHEQLRKDYGFSSLDTIPEVVARRVLKRGSIKSEEEARVLRDLLSVSEYDGAEAERLRFEKILGDFESGKKGGG